MKIILFDGVCNLCNGTVNFVIDHDPKAIFKFTSLQSETGQQLLQQLGKPKTQFDSIILIDNQQVFEKSDAALRIAKQLSGGWSVLYLLIYLPKGFRNFVYDLVAQNRYRLFGKTATCRLPSPQLANRFLDELKKF
jgi:predicted DCC family thiol-disulfide oxidoreductase YuxK